MATLNFNDLLFCILEPGVWGYVTRWQLAVPSGAAAQRPPGSTAAGHGRDAAGVTQPEY